MERVTASTLRFGLFTTRGIISQTGGVTTIPLAVGQPEERNPLESLLLLNSYG